jgi:hypothetical protein
MVIDGVEDRADVADYVHAALFGLAPADDSIIRT